MMRVTNTKTPNDTEVRANLFQPKILPLSLPKILSLAPSLREVHKNFGLSLNIQDIRASMVAGETCLTRINTGGLSFLPIKCHQSECHTMMTLAGRTKELK